MMCIEDIVERNAIDVHKQLKIALNTGVLNVDDLIEAGGGDDYTGFCVCCGAIHEGVEPDARHYDCEECGEKAVFGAEELLLCLPDKIEAA